MIQGSSVSQLNIGPSTALSISRSDIDEFVIQAATSGEIFGNQITHLSIDAAVAGSIHDNRIGGGNVGLHYRAAAMLNGNTIIDSQIGVVVDVSDPTSGLGFAGASANNLITGNLITGNQVGVQLVSGRIQSQTIQANQTGVTGSGILGGDTLGQSNVIRDNQLETNFNGTIQFNRFIDNAIHIQAQSRQLIAHNTFASKLLSPAIVVSGTNRTQIIVNTIFAQGSAVVLQDNSTETEIRGNILWAETGYAIRLEVNSQLGFFSDYNWLYHGSAGKLIRYDNRDFIDVLDWQVDVNQFDLHSGGFTIVDPAASRPRLVDRHTGDLSVWPVAAGLQLTSPTLGRGDSRGDLAVQHGFDNLLVNPSFETGTGGWQANPASNVRGTSPAPHDAASYFVSADQSFDSISQTVDLVAAGYSAAQLDSQSFSIVFGGRVRSQVAGKNRSRIELVLLNAVGQEIGRVSSGDSLVSDRWNLLGERVPLVAGTRSLRYEFLATQLDHSNSQAYFDMASMRLLPASFAPDLGAMSGDASNAAGVTQTQIAMRSPDLYVDWERDRPHDIRWETFANATLAPVKIDLYQKLDPVRAELVKLRYFAGLTMEQSAESLSISLATAHRYWNYARAWLHQEIAGKESDSQNY